MLIDKKKTHIEGPNRWSEDLSQAIILTYRNYSNPAQSTPTGFQMDCSLALNSGQYIANSLQGNCIAKYHRVERIPIHFVLFLPNISRGGRMGNSNLIFWGKLYLDME